MSHAPDGQRVRPCHPERSNEVAQSKDRGNGARASRSLDKLGMTNEC